MWVGVVAMVLGALVVAEVGRRGAAGTLPRNHVAGIRLPSTMRDDETWAIAHQAGGPPMVRTGVAAAGIGVAAGIAGVVIGEAASAGLVLVAAGVLLLGVLWSGWRGVHAARAARPDQPRRT